MLIKRCQHLILRRFFEMIFLFILVHTYPSFALNSLHHMQSGDMEKGTSTYVMKMMRMTSRCP